MSGPNFDDYEEALRRELREILGGDGVADEEKVEEVMQDRRKKLDTQYQAARELGLTERAGQAEIEEAARQKLAAALALTPDTTWKELRGHRRVIHQLSASYSEAVQDIILLALIKANPPPFPFED